MEQRISLVTLGVADLARARAFYERLGWRGQEVEETVFYQAGGLGVVLWSREKLAEDAGIIEEEGAGIPEDEGTGITEAGGSGAGGSRAGATVRGGDGFGGLTLAHNVRSRAEVDEVLAVAAAGGARITRPARETFYGGYAGCFADPDGHVWEIAWNPGFPLADDGTITIPDFGQP
ncbi:VOC family protein [Micromonospora olivasterospora]|uniref:VOC domain-containing protein n=1 Tax=Micromonospora olivasterospora TaxID=1880 RepID=A0A562IDA8_MICOL|nr:VOC family protein [Micromonospora olivasterospora]TWH68614.1 hypothetical protein JD77_03611 [Micromonospora olivasterospora]